ncbi:IclR family transcriptional regulator [Achromobacter sp. ACM01]|uniref:IclR family transcriptional regulator n=1 Tax=Achromobacter sp. ACM01 TaxID=2769298 RepID=UPI001CE1F545|nr:IclR family transcriptional regulator [Achromobacter sp. ACM01]
MNSLRRMLDVLDLFQPDRPVLDVDAICQLRGYAPATAYRYVRELCACGLLVRLPAGYALGPRIIALDLQMREYDPMLTVSRDLIEELSSQTGLDVLLSARYDDKVINVHQQAGRNTQALNFGRGRHMPLLRSATARVILANLGPRQLRRVYDEHADVPDMQRLGQDWKSFSRAMLQVRKAGYCISSGELDSGKTGIAAPIFDEENHVLGSITLIGMQDAFAAFREDYLAGLTCRAATEITRRIAQAPAKLQQAA